MLERKASIQHGLGDTQAAIGSLESALRLVQPTNTTAVSPRVASIRQNIEALQRTLVPEPPQGRPQTPISDPRSRSRKVARRNSLP